MRIALFFLALSTGILYAGDTNAPLRNMEVTTIGSSPLQTFNIEQHALSPDEVLQIWLVSSKNPKERSLLYAHSRSVEVIVSEDEHYLVINDRGGSDFANVLLFRKQRGLAYKQIEDLTDKAWKFMAARSGHKKPPALDHSYAEVLRWTDSHTILLSLHGHLDRRNFVKNWLCLYDITSKTFSTDLDSHNKKHTTLEGESDVEKGKK